jgi:hypothetical protein
MKKQFRYLLLVFFFLFSACIFAQKDSINFINEFGVSVNQNNLFLADDGVSYGYSISAYHTNSAKKLVSFAYGVELNSTNIKGSYIRLNRWYSYRDFSFSIYSLSAPLLLRFGFKPVKNNFIFFGETGVRLDYKLYSYLKSTTEFVSYSSVPSSSSTSSGRTNELKPFSIIPSIGLGVAYRLHKLDLILKVDCRISSLTYRPSTNYEFGSIGFSNLSLQVRFNHK